jgi:hypothetical protein
MGNAIDPSVMFSGIQNTIATGVNAILPTCGYLLAALTVVTLLVSLAQHYLHPEEDDHDYSHDPFYRDHIEDYTPAELVEMGIWPEDTHYLDGYDRYTTYGEIKESEGWG